MNALHQRFASTACLVVICLASSVVSASDPVSFDVPALAIAQRVNPDVVEHPTTGGKLFRIRLPISTFMSSQSRSRVEQYVVRVTSPQLTMRVVDFWPKTETYSQVEGAVTVKTSVEGAQQLGAKGTASYAPVGQAGVDASMKRSTRREETFQQKPPMEVLSSSGTLHRGYGAFFKFLAGPQAVLEGAREIAVLVEVPTHWRADMLHVSLEAIGRTSQRKSVHHVGSSQLWTAVYQEGDTAAAAQASRYVTQERSLRALAAASREDVSKKSLPSVWHKLGAALDVVEPKIPEDYLSQAIFSSRYRYRDNLATSRLPVDLRVAILDYWDERERLAAMARGQYVASESSSEPSEAFVSTL
ncbi:MAG: hypothetical protein Aurels2KO_18210 [Aureliella sp.]